MAHAPQPGDVVPDDVLQELTDDIETGRCVIPRPVFVTAVAYARRYLNMANPSDFELWDYIVDRLQITGRWQYAQLDEYYPYPALGYALHRADGRRLYIKLRYNDQSRVELMSFHD